MMAPLLLARALQLLTARVAGLEERVRAGDESAWSPYLDAIRALAQLDKPERGAMLSTADMAARLGVRPKSLLRRVQRGDVRPAVRSGKLIRWRGDEIPAPASGGQRPGQGSRGVAPTVATRVARNGPGRLSEAARSAP